MRRILPCSSITHRLSAVMIVSASSSSSSSKPRSGVSLECSTITDSSREMALVAVDADPKGDAILEDSETSESVHAKRSDHQRCVARSRSSSIEEPNRRKRASTSDAIVQVSSKGVISSKGKTRSEAHAERTGTGSRSGRGGARDAAGPSYAARRSPVAARGYDIDSNGRWHPRTARSRGGSIARRADAPKDRPRRTGTEVFDWRPPSSGPSPVA